MGKKLTYEYVKNYIEIESNSDCKLLSNDYINAKTKLILQCKCGEIFKVHFNSFKSQNMRRCDKCYRESMRNKFKFDISFIKEEIEKHGYQLTSNKYENAYTKLELICPEGHQITMDYIHFKRGHRCPKCKGGVKINHEEFLKRCKSLYHFDEYEILSKYINSKTKIKILHKICKTQYQVEPNHFLIGQKCPRCFLDKKSEGFEFIEKYLLNNDITFIFEYAFDDCVYKRKLRFDFALFDKNDKLTSVIEYDGIQHFEPVEAFGGINNLEITKERDRIKNNYCKNNNITIIRIPYWQLDKINEILTLRLKKLNLV